MRLMKRKVVVALLFGLVVVLAGCSGGIGDALSESSTTDASADPDPDDDSDDASDDDTDDSADDGDDSSDGDADDTDGSTDDDSDDSTDDDADDTDDWERTNAQTALESAGSYTSTWVWRSNVDDTGEMRFTTQVDFTTDRILNTMRIGGDEVNVIDNYYADGVQYTRFASENGDDATYFQSEASFDAAGSVWDYGFAYDSSAFEEWSDQGTETYDGVTVRRYVYDASEQYLGGQPTDSEFDVTSARFELLVDNDGVPRYQLYEVEGTDDDGAEQWFEWELTVTDVGSTTVDEPAWIQQTSDQ